MCVETLDLGRGAHVEEAAHLAIDKYIKVRVKQGDVHERR